MREGIRSGGCLLRLSSSAIPKLNICGDVLWQYGHGSSVCSKWGAAHEELLLPTENGGYDGYDERYFIYSTLVIVAAVVML